LELKPNFKFEVIDKTKPLNQQLVGIIAIYVEATVTGLDVLNNIVIPNVPNGT
jgi:hypothetical protein